MGSLGEKLVINKPRLRRNVVALLSLWWERLEARLHCEGCILAPRRHHALLNARGATLLSLCSAPSLQNCSAFQNVERITIPCCGNADAAAKSLTHDTTNRLVFELSQNCSTDRHLLQKSETMECMPFYLHRFFCWK